jgi:RNA polymerase primary sigma factor
VRGARGATDVNSKPGTIAGSGDRKPKRPHRQAETLDRYIHDLEHLPLLERADEIALAQEIEQRVLAHWFALLSYPRARAVIAQTLQAKLPGAAAELAPLCEELTEGSAQAKRQQVSAAAQSLQQRDFGQAALTACDAAVREAFATEGREQTYLARVAEAKAAAQRAKGRFVSANLRLVISIARRYQQGSVPLNDLIQEGNLGLMQAVDRFDHRRGLRFSTYASWWIRHSLKRALSDKARVVRVPVHTLDDDMRAARLRSRLLSATGVEPTTSELAQQLRIPVARLERIRTEASLKHAVSFDQPIGPEHSRTLHDVLPAEEETDHAEAIDQAARIQEVLELLGTLTSNEASILRLRFGLGETEELSLSEIGLKYDLSRERIRQLQGQALAKLRVLPLRHNESRSGVAA